MLEALWATVMKELSHLFNTPILMDPPEALRNKYLGVQKTETFQTVRQGLLSEHL